MILPKTIHKCKGQCNDHNQYSHLKVYKQNIFSLDNATHVA